MTGTDENLISALSRTPTIMKTANFQDYEATASARTQADMDDPMMNIVYLLALVGEF